MSVNDAILKQLQEMGIEWNLARAAAQRYHSVDAAVNWCFGPGADWKPEDDMPKGFPPRIDFTDQSGATVTHHEVYDSANSSTSNLIDMKDDLPDHTPKSPPLPPRPGSSNLSAPFASNNPFRNNPPPPVQVEDDEDEDLRKALAMSREGMEGEDKVDDQRAERERSVRASGVPPPSPEGGEVPNTSVTFGPSEKNDQEGKLAMIPSTQGPVNQTSTEDQDMEKAIADSLMTASFHSASALQAVEKPKARVRDPETPLVFWSELGNSTYAALVLQGLIAIPQFREAISGLKLDDLPSHEYMKMTYLQELIERYQSPGNDFVEVDGSLKEIRNGHEPSQLPPAQPTLELSLQLQGLTRDLLNRVKDLGPNTEKPGTFGYSQDPSQLFVSEINMDPTQSSSYVDFWRQGPASELNMYSMLATILWQQQPNASIEYLSDILTVRLIWNHGATRELWKIDERVVLDRYLRQNAHRSIKIRAQQHAASSNARRTKDKINDLTQHKGQNTLENIAALVKFYENSPATDDPVKTQSRNEIKAKLQDILAKLEEKKAVLDDIVRKEEEAMQPTAFDTDDQEMNKHVYILRAVLFHDGALVSGQHLYAYIRQDDGSWWKIQEHQATKVDFDSIATDKTGLFMDGGPYVLLYSREGPRPAMPVPVEETLIDLDESPSVDTATPQESINVDRSDGTTITVGKPDFGDESTTEEKTEKEDVSML